MKKIYLIITVILSLVIGVTLSGVIGNFTDDLTSGYEIIEFYDVNNLTYSIPFEDLINYKLVVNNNNEFKTLSNLEDKDENILFNKVYTTSVASNGIVIESNRNQPDNTYITFFDDGTIEEYLFFTLMIDSELYLVKGTSAQITGTTATLVNMIPLIVVLSIVITGVIVAPKISKE